MIAAVDVDYRQDGTAVAGCVLFGHWTDEAPAETRIARLAKVEEYRAGEFFRRELPPLLAVLAPLRGAVALEAVVVDGYVWLDDGNERPGLGAHLYEALGRTVPVVGVAKTGFAGQRSARPVLRGTSRRPLFVTAVGMTTDEAAAKLLAMHGSFRIPTLLREVDRLCRTA